MNSLYDLFSDCCSVLSVYSELYNSRVSNPFFILHHVLDWTYIILFLDSYANFFIPHPGMISHSWYSLLFYLLYFHIIMYLNLGTLLLLYDNTTPCAAEVVAALTEHG